MWSFLDQSLHIQGKLLGRLNFPILSLKVGYPKFGVKLKNPRVRIGRTGTHFTAKRDSLCPSFEFWQHSFQFWMFLSLHPLHTGEIMCNQPWSTQHKRKRQQNNKLQQPAEVSASILILWSSPWIPALLPSTESQLRNNAFL